MTSYQLQPMLERERNRPLQGVLTATPDLDIVEVLSRQFDWLYVDLEHSTTPLDIVPSIVRTCEHANAGVLVRIPEDDFGKVNPILDAGADGIVFPHVSTAADAEEAVTSSKYPPVGERGIGYGRAQGFGRRTRAHVAAANDSVITSVLVESVEGVANIDAITRVSGVDMVVVGPLDLLASAGRLAETGEDGGGLDYRQIFEALETISAATDANGQSLCLPSGDSRMASTAIELGADLTIVGSELSIILDWCAGNL